MNDFRISPSFAKARDGTTAKFTELDPRKTQIRFYTRDAKAAKIDPIRSKRPEEDSVFAFLCGLGVKTNVTQWKHPLHFVFLFT